VTGIGMINVRQRLPAMVARLQKESDLHVDFLCLDPAFVRTHAVLSDQLYRPGLEHDLHQFESDLRRVVSNADLSDRIRLHHFSGFMTFVTTVANLDSWGSMMLVETILPVEGYEVIERPRLLLRRRCSNGLYDRFAGAIRSIKRESRPVTVS
jgi:hypothetical protein